MKADEWGGSYPKPAMYRSKASRGGWTWRRRGGFYATGKAELMIRDSHLDFSLTALLKIAKVQLLDTCAHTISALGIATTGTGKGRKGRRCPVQVPNPAA